MKAKTRLRSLSLLIALIIGLWACSAYATTQQGKHSASDRRVATDRNPQSENGDQLKPEHADESVSLLTRYDVSKGHLKIFRKVLRSYVRRVIRQDHNIMAEAFSEEKDPAVMWVIERWSSKEALYENRKRIQNTVVKLVSEKKLTQPATEFYVRDLEPLSTQEWRRESSAEEKSITIMLFVDSNPGTEDNFKEVYHTAMPQFRSEPGVVTYQLSQFVEDNTRFVTYEKFRNEEAFQYHLKFPPIQPVLDYLNTSIRQQPFQSGLHRLVMFAPFERK